MDEKAVKIAAQAVEKLDATETNIFRPTPEEIARAAISTYLQNAGGEYGDTVKRLRRHHDEIQAFVSAGMFKSETEKIAEIDRAMESCWQAAAAIETLVAQRDEARTENHAWQSAFNNGEYVKRAAAAEGEAAGQWETPCPAREDSQHCNCWYDGERCCACGDPAETSTESDTGEDDD